MLKLNTAFNLARRRLGLSYYPLSTRIKRWFPGAAEYIAQYERWIARHAMERGFDGVVSGHIHWAANRTIDVGGRKIAYVNTGDWTESLTAAVEDFDGRIELVQSSGPSRR